MNTFLMNSSWLGPLIRAVESCNITAERFLEGEITNADLEDPLNVSMSYAKITHLWNKAVALTGEPAIGLIAARFATPNTFGPLLLAMSSSRDALTALKTFAECSEIGSNVAVWRLRETNDFVELTRQGRVGKGADELKDGVAAVIVNICQGLGNPLCRPTRLVIGRPAPKDVTPWVNHFAVMPIFSEGGRTVIRFSRESVEVKNPSYDPEFFEICRSYLERKLCHIRSNSFLGIVNGKIVSAIETGNLHIDQVAKSLGLSRRTLQRRLWKEAQISFGDLVKAARLGRAEELLIRSNRSIEEISYLLCYGSVSSFSRSFRKATGYSPSKFRQTRR